MKVVKKLLVYEVLTIILFVFMYFEFSFLCSYADKFNNSSTSVFVNQQKLERPLIKSTISLNNNIAEITEEIKFTENSKDFWLNMPSSLFAETKIINITPGNYQLESLNEDAAMHLSFSKEISSVVIQYEVNLINERKILSHQDNTVLLTEFSITPAPIINGKPTLIKKINYGDPFAYQMHDYDITLTFDSNFKAYAPGKTSEQIVGKQKKCNFQAEAMRDFPIALLLNPQEVKYKIRDIDVTYIGTPEVHQDVLRIFDFIENKTFLYPYKEFFVISAPIDQRGMEFSQMIFVSDEFKHNKILFDKILCHEIFHQWFYGLVGTDQINEPFMDEGLTNYLTKSYFNEKITTRYNLDLVNMGMEKFLTKDYYNRMIYEDGASYFYKLQKDYGVKFDNLLKNLSNKYRDNILTKEMFLNEVELMKIGDD